MKTGWILVFFVISLFFISGQAGCEMPSTGTSIPSGISTVSGGNGLNVDIESIGIIDEGEEFAVYIHLANKGKAVEPTIKMWDMNKDLGAVPNEEYSLSLEDARTERGIEVKEEDITFGPYTYTNVKSDITTNLIVDVNADYSVSITPEQGLCVAKKESKLCSSTESISDLGDEAAAVPITVTGITKSYKTIENIVNLVLQISLADKGQGSGLNENINNFDVSLRDGTRLKCNVGSTVNIKQLKEPIKCTTKIDLSEEARSEQVTISFDYNYLIRRTIPIQIRAKKIIA